MVAIFKNPLISHHHAHLREIRGGGFTRGLDKDYGEYEETDLGDDETEILSVTFNIKYDEEVQKIIDVYNWDELEG